MANEHVRLANLKAPLPRPLSAGASTLTFAISNAASGSLRNPDSLSVHSLDPTTWAIERLIVVWYLE